MALVSITVREALQAVADRHRMGGIRRHRTTTPSAKERHEEAPRLQALAKRRVAGPASGPASVLGPSADISGAILGEHLRRVRRCKVVALATTDTHTEDDMRRPRRMARSGSATRVSTIPQVPPLARGTTAADPVPLREPTSLQV